MIKALEKLSAASNAISQIKNSKKIACREQFLFDFECTFFMIVPQG